jgi:RDD family
MATDDSNSTLATRPTYRQMGMRQGGRAARWVAGRVFVEDGVWTSEPAAGVRLRETFLASMPALTLGLVRRREDSLWCGPIELLRLGAPRVTEDAVEWPIEGGWVVGVPGGALRIHAEPGRLEVSVLGYRPRLPRPLYAITQLPVHHLLSRLYLLHIRGRTPPPGPIATQPDRYRAAAVDIGFCAGLAWLTGRRHRVRTFAGILAGYHLACWSLSGRTLGGLAMNQRVVAADGSRLSPAQALVRLVAVPISLLGGRSEHDIIAGTEVIEG